MTAIVAFIISHELPDWNGHPKLLSILTKKSNWNRKGKNCLNWVLFSNDKIYFCFFITGCPINIFIALWISHFMIYAVKISCVDCSNNLCILMQDSFCHNSYCFWLLYFSLSCAIRRNLQSVKGTQNYLLRVLVRKIKNNFSTSATKTKNQVL